MVERKTFRWLVLWLTLFLFFLNPCVLAVDLLFFYEQGCPECARTDDFLQKRIKANYSLEIKKYEIHEPKNAKLMLDLAGLFSARDVVERGTPVVFIADKAFQGSSRAVLRKVEEAVRAAVKAGAASPLDRLSEAAPEEKFGVYITLPALIGAAAIDAINPCACAVLVLLLGTILLASQRKKRAVIGAGLAFTAACFISYFLMGLGLYSAVRVSGIQHYVYIAVSILALILGLWNIKDFIWCKQGFKIGVPQSWQPRIKQITSGIASIWGAFIMGLLISLFLLPCTSGPYVVIIGMLGSTATRFQAIWLLLLYNSIFILPFVIITLVVGFGFTTTARIEKWRQKRLGALRFLTGLFMFFLGTVLLLMLILGRI